MTKHDFNCPYCQAGQSCEEDFEDIESLSIPNEIEHRCDACERPFAVFLTVSIDFETEDIEALCAGDHDFRADPAFEKTSAFGLTQLKCRRCGEVKYIRQKDGQEDYPRYADVVSRAETFGPLDQFFQWAV